MTTPVTPTISVIHASRGRPEKAAAAIAMWRDRASNPKQVEYILSVDQDDSTRFDMQLGDCSRGFGAFLLVDNKNKGSAEAWDFGAKFSRGELLVQAQDDVEPPQNWDALLLLKLREQPYDGGPDGWKNLPAFIAVADGYRNVRLCCTAIMNRARYEQQGEFLHAGYKSVYSDDEVTVRAYADAANGKCTLIEARDLVFLHRHHYHDKSVPMDATYERENSAEAYALGSALFMQRNADLVARGFKTW